MRLVGSSALVLLLAACSVSMSTGGFPPQIRTVAVLPFENNTSDPTLAQDVNRAVREAVQSRLDSVGAQGTSGAVDAIRSQAATTDTEITGLQAQVRGLQAQVKELQGKGSGAGGANGAGASGLPVPSRSPTSAMR